MKPPIDSNFERFEQISHDANFVRLVIDHWFTGVRETEQTEASLSALAEVEAHVDRIIANSSREFQTGAFDGVRTQ